MQALVAQAPPHNVLRATPSFSAEFGAAAGGAVAVGGPVAFLVGPETCRGTAAVLLDASANARLIDSLGDYDDGRSHGVLHVATAVGLPLSAYIVAASVYFATTIPYASDFFCDG